MCVVVLSAEVRVGASTYERLESYLMAMLDVRTVRVHNFAQLCTTLHNVASTCVKCTFDFLFSRYDWAICFRPKFDRLHMPCKA